MGWSAPSPHLEWESSYPHPNRRVGISLLAEPAKPLRAPRGAYGLGITVVPLCMIFHIAVHKVAPNPSSLRRKRFVTLLQLSGFRNVVAYILLNTGSARCKNWLNKIAPPLPLASLVVKEIIPFPSVVSTLYSNGRIGVWIHRGGTGTSDYQQSGALL